MKATKFFTMFLATWSITALPSLAQQSLDIEGPAVGTPLTRITATDITVANDILEIIAPLNPTSTIGQFIECQAAGIEMQVNWD